MRAIIGGPYLGGWGDGVLLASTSVEKGVGFNGEEEEKGVWVS